MQGFLIQIFWIFTLIILGQVILAQGVKKLVIQGG
jgi:ABC-type uncharacterized transport system permease subunit